MKKSQSADHLPKSAETHQTADDLQQTLRTNQGIPVADNQNSLRAGTRGPILLEDFVLREKITHFDHERIPERIVHARGTGAHGRFVCLKSCADICKAAFLQKAGETTEVFVRFSTVAGGAGSGDMPRDVRGFAVKFYTSEGNFDLVGNNIPVFFIQDPIKFPDLVHAVKMEADRGFPQAATAHDTFWDFISLTPESMHMVAWIMSDRTIPKSLRTIEGFGVHTFRMMNARGESHFVKFHWRPTIGAESVVWDEAVKINGADPDFHRRDLWEAIESGQFPEWELGIQVFDQKTADAMEFDILDPTKLIPEETIPLRIIGKLTLDRNVDNFFAETEQVAFCPANIVPGIGFSNDPLLQGRLFSYLDTQLSRLGGPNFHQLAVNAPRCPFHNQQRDGIHQMQIPKGRANYEPNSIDPAGPRENPALGYKAFAESVEGPKTTLRAETFADHYSQARQFYRSMSEPEKRHMASALTFELSKVEMPHIRKRMLGHLELIDKDLAKQVETGMGMEGEAEPISPAIKPKDLPPSDALSLLKKAVPTLKGRTIGALVSDGFDPALLKALKKEAKAEGARIKVIAPKIGSVTDRAGTGVIPDATISGSPSVFYDAVAVLVSDGEAGFLVTQAAVIDWVRDAYGHFKVIGCSGEGAMILQKAGVLADDAVLELNSASSVTAFIQRAKQGRAWDREPRLRRI